jgi:hypothetical protein
VKSTTAPISGPIDVDIPPMMVIMIMVMTQFRLKAEFGSMLELFRAISAPATPTKKPCHSRFQ